MKITYTTGRIVVDRSPRSPVDLQFVELNSLAVSILVKELGNAPSVTI